MKKNTNNTTLLWALLCASSSVDSGSNNLSVFNIIEEITLNRKDFPEKTDRVEIATNLQLVSLIKRGSEKGKFTVNMKLRLVDPNDKELSSIEFSIEFPEDKIRMRQLINIPSLSITEKGEYNFEVHIKIADEEKYKKSGEVPIMVNIR